MENWFSWKSEKEGKHLLIAITSWDRRPKTIGSPLEAKRGVLGGHLSTRSTERLPSDERVCVTQHGVQEEGVVNEEREREEASHPRLTHGGRSMEFQRGEDRLLNWRRASKGRRRPPCFSPLTRRGNPVLRPDASDAARPRRFDVRQRKRSSAV